MLPPPQVPPGTDIDAPFVALAKAFHRNYEEKVAAYIDACRNY
jgi:transport family protein 27